MEEKYGQLNLNIVTLTPQLMQKSSIQWSELKRIELNLNSLTRFEKLYHLSDLNSADPFYFQHDTEICKSKG